MLFKILKKKYFSWNGFVCGKQRLVNFWANDDLDLNRREIYGLMAELNTLETSRMARKEFFCLQGLFRIMEEIHLNNMTKLCVALLLWHKALSEELIHNVGKVGHDEDEDHFHWQISHLYPGLGEHFSPVYVHLYFKLVTFLFIKSIILPAHYKWQLQSRQYECSERQRPREWWQKIWWQPHWSTSYAG